MTHHADGCGFGGGGDAGVGRADLGLAALVKPEKKAPLPFRGDKVLVDVQGVGREFVGVLPRNPPAPEMLLRSLLHIREERIFKVGAEGQEPRLRVRVESPQLRHVLLPHVLVLIEEHPDLPPRHALLLFVKKPRHAVEEDGAPRALDDFRQLGEELRVAEPQDRILRLQHPEIMRQVHLHAPPDHLLKERLPWKPLVGRNQVHL